MAHEFKYRRRVEFVDTDLAGIVHFSNFFRFMEQAEHAFFRSLGLTLHGTHEGRTIGWARGHAACDYRRPAHYEEVLEVQLAVRDKTESELEYELVFQRVGPDDTPEEELARGRLRVVCVAREKGDGRLRRIPMPPAVDELVQVAPVS